MIAGTPVERRVASAVVPNAAGYKDERPGLGSLVIRLESWLLSRVAPGTLSNVERRFGRHIWLRGSCGKRTPTLALALSFCLLCYLSTLVTPPLSHALLMVTVLPQSEELWLSSVIHFLFSFPSYLVHV